MNKNILVACDQNYYNDWAEAFLKSAYNRNPWLRNKLFCHIVNPTSFTKLPYVTYSLEDRTFSSDESRIAYLQAVRFLAVAEKISNTELFVTVDADTICTKSFTEKEFEKVFNNTHVLKHRKAGNWLAGFVTFNNPAFAIDYATRLQAISIDNWNIGRDQVILAELAKDYKFKELPLMWMVYGKNKYGSIFYTLKGDQKITQKYKSVYDKYVI